MKRLFTILVASALLISSSFAQAPQNLSYQAVIRNSYDQLVTNQTVGMRISILQSSISGTTVYQETQTPTSNANGLVTLEIGSGTTTFDISAIDWASGPYFLKTEMDLSGGTNYSITGTSQLLSVPYALHALTAEKVINSNIHYIGELFGGGIIVSVWKENGIEKGLIASLVDISSGTAWSNMNLNMVESFAQSPVDGKSNSSAIINQIGHISSAAQLCDSYEGGGYNDWYLPASWELMACFNASYIVNSILGPTDGFQFSNYWTSTEEYPNRAWLLYFGKGTLEFIDKEAEFRVRAVRRF